MDGVADNQPTIFQNGMNAGMEKQKNIDELARNWTVCSWWTLPYSSWHNVAYCKNDNPYNVRSVKPDYSTDFEYTPPLQLVAVW